MAKLQMRNVRTILLLLALCRTGAADEDGFETGTDEEESDTGPELGVRLGYGVTSGNLGREANLHEAFPAGLPIGFDLGYRLDENWFVGGFAEYALASPSATVTRSCEECTYTWLHLALSVQYRVIVTPTYDVWVGLGTGRHWLNATLGNTVRVNDVPVRVTRTQTFSGPSYVHFHLGSTMRAASGVGIGPYTSLALGDFDEGVEICPDENFCPIERREFEMGRGALHTWFSSGVRIVFLP